MDIFHEVEGIEPENEEGKTQERITMTPLEEKPQGQDAEIPSEEKKPQEQDAGLPTA